MPESFQFFLNDDDAVRLKQMMGGETKQAFFENLVKRLLDESGGVAK